jgi:hypothetical protein
MDRPFPGAARRSPLPVLFALLAGCSATTSSTPVARPHPQRPTISFDTYTTPEDAVELEAGLSIDPGDRFAVPALLKYGVGPRTEFFLGGFPFLSVDQGSVDESGIGDGLVGFRHRLADETDESPSSAFQIATKVPTASESKGLGTGEVDLYMAAMAEKHFGYYGVNGFYQLGILGDPGGSGSDLQHTFAVQGTRPAWEEWTPFGELAFLWTPEQDDERLFLTGGTYYLVSEEVTLDFGVRLGLTEDAPDFALLVGLTWALGSLTTGPIQ